MRLDFEVFDRHAACPHCAWHLARQGERGLETDRTSMDYLPRLICREAARGIHSTGAGGGGPLVFRPRIEAAGWTAQPDYFNAEAYIELARPSTAIKNSHLRELAFVWALLARTGNEVRGATLYLLDKSYFRTTVLEPTRLFRPVDVTRQAGVAARSIGPRLDPVRQDCEAEFPPAARCGRTGGGGRPGASRLESIRGKKARVMKLAEATGEVQIDRAALEAFLARVRYPLAFLDFECYSSPVPPFPGIRPWEHVPFAYSVHFVETEGGRPVWASFTGDGKGDRRGALVEALSRDLSGEGSILVFNAEFERRMLGRLAAWHPQAAPWLAAAAGRVIDLGEPFKAFSVYSPRQVGSLSLKRILPALTGRGYEGLEVDDGGEANRLYLELLAPVLGVDGFARPDADSVRLSIEAYCRRDTEALVVVLDELRRLAASGTTP